MHAVARDVADLFAALGDRIRLRLACCLLAVPTGACVCELVDALDVSQPNISRHLKVLKAAGLVDERREGRWIYYRLRQPDHPLLDGILALDRAAGPDPFAFRSEWEKIHDPSERYSRPKPRELA